MCSGRYRQLPERALCSDSFFCRLFLQKGQGLSKLTITHLKALLGKLCFEDLPAAVGRCSITGELSVHTQDSVVTIALYLVIGNVFCDARIYFGTKRR